MTESQRHFVPPYPAIPETDLSRLRFLKAVRTNALQIWPRAAFERDHLVQPFLGRTRTVLNAPEAIHRVLVENTQNYRRSRASIRILRPLMGKGLLLSEGDDWKLQRRTIAPALAPRMIPMLARHIAAATADTVAGLREQSRTPVDLFAAMQFLALEIAGRSMFSMEMRDCGAEMRARLTRFGLDLARPHLLDLLLPASIPTPRDLARRRFQAGWMAFIERIMEARLRQPHEGAARDLFDLLLAARDPETGSGFSREQLRDQIATMIIAGHETTAVSLFWSLYLLASVDHEQDRVAAEVRGRALGPETAGEALADLPVTRAVVSEAMRLFPPIFTLVREAIGDDLCGGAAIRRGSLVMIAPWVLHRHRNLWREPDAFDPSRFLPGAPPVPRFAYLPFGAGPRICVGAQFAMAEATLVLATLVQNFRITLADRRPVLPVAVIATHPDHPPPFRLEPRERALPLAA
jgi:cytochrome P450